jgi:endonuclease YncB( thermonuclease family)
VNPNFYVKISRVKTQIVARPFYQEIALSLALFVLMSVAVIPEGQTFVCTPTHVWDGDGPIWCKEGPRIRIAGIACKPNHPCPRASAEAARDALVKLIGQRTGWSHYGHALVEGRPLRCQSTGPAGGNRTGAWCHSPKSGDLSCAMVRSGTVAKWAPYWKRHKCKNLD